MLNKVKNILRKTDYINTNDEECEEDNYDVNLRSKVNNILQNEDVSHRKRPLFCELLELQQKNTFLDVEWIETARWIKFEEDVDVEGDRWSKPHVATLSQSSINVVKRALQNGLVMLDMEVYSYEHLIDNIIQALNVDNKYTRETCVVLKRVLTSRHKHLFQGDYHIIKEDKINSMKQKISFDVTDESGSNNLSDTEHGIDEKTRKNNFQKKLVKGTEAANILSGYVDFLDEAITVFVRLGRSCNFGDLTEVAVKSRFLCIFIGPHYNSHSHHEIGRAMATILVDDIFHDIAYKAANVQDLIIGIDEFLDQSTLLPPGEWDPTIRVEPPQSIPDQEYRKQHDSDETTNVIAHKAQELKKIDCRKIFHGLISDVKRKVPFYLSDYKDALNMQTIPTVIFLYFAAVSTVITFAGVMQDEIYYIGVTEGLLGLGICGVVHHLFSGQPLIIFNSTGPILAFEIIVYTFCKEYGINFLPMRFWIGFWISVFILIIVVLNLAHLARYITRFTQECFASLISLIVCYQAIKNLMSLRYANLDSSKYMCMCFFKATEKVCDYTLTRAYYYSDIIYASEKPALNFTDSVFKSGFQMVNFNSPNLMKSCNNISGIILNNYNFSQYDTESPSKAFYFSCFLFIGTFFIAYSLKTLTTARVFSTLIRNTLADFAVTIAISFMVICDLIFKYDTDKLNVPDSVVPTVDRKWVVNVMDNPSWIIPASIIPALLGTILIVLDTEITILIVSKKQNKLKKSCGHHLDLFICAGLILLMSLLGFPWFIAAPILSITHVKALSILSTTAAPGESPQFLGTREQRVTGLLSFLMIGLSVFFSKVLVHFPKAVLYGVFMYMGISSLRGLEIVQRVSIIFMSKKNQPDYSWLRKVPLRRIHFYTALQIVCLIILVVVKQIEIISVAFPILILLLIFVRVGLNFVFSQHELKWLDDLLPKRSNKIKKVNKVEIPLDDFPYQSNATKDTKSILKNNLNVDNSEDSFKEEKHLDDSVNTEFHISSTDK